MNYASPIVWLVAAALWTAGASAEPRLPYAGQDWRPIKALSDDEIRDLLDARGLGLAKAAELNSYPGPIHVLQLASKLALSDAQREASEALYDDMRLKAQTIGRKIVEAERTLDQSFASGRIEAATLRVQVNAVAVPAR